MARILFVAPPWAGHVNPTVPVARALAARGHQVAWAGSPALFTRLLPAGAEIVSLGDDRGAELLAEEMAKTRARTARQLESVRYLWESVLVPLARAMREPVELAIESWRPDVMVVDHQAIGGALAARRRGVPWATLCTTSASVIDHFAGLPKVKAWRDGLLADLEREAGILPQTPPDLSPSLVIVFSTDAMVGPVSEFPAHYRFVGPAVIATGDDGTARGDASGFPWDALDPAKPKVFVSLGTLWADRELPFFPIAAEAAAGAPWQTILVAPDDAVPPPGDPRRPGDLIVLPRVPQLALLPRVDAVVSHGGHNTVCETLAAGKPLVVAPIRDDQPAVADQVVRAGAGLRLHFGRLNAKVLREAITRVLDEPSFAAAAARVRASFIAGGGAARAATLLEGLAP